MIEYKQSSDIYSLGVVFYCLVFSIVLDKSLYTCDRVIATLDINFEELRE